MKRKPKITLNCVANHYAEPNERIIEFSHENGGGLVSFSVLNNGNLLVSVYRQDETVYVTSGKCSMSRAVAHRKAASNPILKWTPNQ